MKFEEIKQQIEAKGLIFLKIKDRGGKLTICAFDNRRKTHPYRYFNISKCESCANEKLVYAFTNTQYCRTCYHKVMGKHLKGVKKNAS